MVDDIVHDDPDATGMGGGEEGFEIGLAAIIRLQLAVIGHRVAVVMILALVDGHQPDPLHPEGL